MNSYYYYCLYCYGSLCFSRGPKFGNLKAKSSKSLDSLRICPGVDFRNFMNRPRIVKPLYFQKQVGVWQQHNPPYCNLFHF
jgi:hypothetical protein